MPNAPTQLALPLRRRPADRRRSPTRRLLPPHPNLLLTSLSLTYRPWGRKGISSRATWRRRSSPQIHLLRRRPRMAPPAAAAAVAVLLRGRPSRVPAPKMQALRRLDQGERFPAAWRPQFPPQRLPFHRVSSPVLRPAVHAHEQRSTASLSHRRHAQHKNGKSLPRFLEEGSTRRWLFCRWCWTPSVRGRRRPARSTIRVRPGSHAGRRQGGLSMKVHSCGCLEGAAHYLVCRA